MRATLLLLGLAGASARTSLFGELLQSVEGLGLESPYVLTYKAPLNYEAASEDDSVLPVVTLHGLGDACENSGMDDFTKQLAKGTGGYGTCIEFGAGSDTFLTTIPAQVKKACDAIKADSKLAGGFNIVGLSQGNCIARGVIEQCASAQVHNYISLGGPHMGVATLPNCNGGAFCDVVNYFIGLGVYTGLAQDHIGPANYYKDPKKIDDYLKSNIWLPDVNNEKNSTNAGYKSKMVKLDALTMVMFAADTVVDPKESEWFGFYQDGSTSKVLAFNETKDYSQDSFGVKTLNEAGKIAFVTQPGEHLNIDDKLVDNTIIPALKKTSAKKTTIKKIAIQ